MNTRSKSDKMTRSNISQNVSSKHRVILALITAFILIFSLLTHPKTSHAGVLDTITNFFGASHASANAGQSIQSQVSPSLSQTKAYSLDQRLASKQLLHSATNINPNPNKDDVAMVVVSSSALLSESGPSGTALDIENEPQNTQISTYIVQKGDSLENIAKMFKVSVNTILWANDLSRSSVLKENQAITILPVSGIKYTIKKGDTLLSIAKKYNADVDEITQFNDMSNKSILVPGTDIIIPDIESFGDSKSGGLNYSVASANSNISNARPSSVRGANAPSYPGYYMCPIKGGTRTQGLHGYNAIDLADELGTPIYAAAAGTVVVSNTGGWHGGYGNYIVISHNNGTQTLYAHTSKNLVSLGDIVKRGQEIAKMGTTGKSTGSHVHFEVHLGKNPC